MTPAECRPQVERGRHRPGRARQGAEPWLCGFGLRLQARDSRAWSGSLASGAPAPSAAVVPHGGGTHGSERGCATPVPRPPVSCCGWGDCGLGSVGVCRAAQHPAVRCRPLALARGSEHGALQPGRRSCFRLGPEAAETWPGSWPRGPLRADTRLASRQPKAIACRGRQHPRAPRKNSETLRRVTHPGRPPPAALPPGPSASWRLEALCHPTSHGVWPVCLGAAGSRGQTGSPCGLSLSRA